MVTCYIIKYPPPHEKKERIKKGYFEPLSYQIILFNTINAKQFEICSKMLPYKTASLARSSYI